MSSDQQTTEFSGASAMGAGTGTSSPPSPPSPTDEHPEMLVAAAFAGGFAAAMILKRLVG